MSAFQKVFSLLFILFIANLFIFISPASAESSPCLGDWCPLSTANYQDEVATQRFGRNILVFGHVALFGTNPLGGQTYSEKVAYNTVNGKIVASAVPGIGPGNINDGALAMAGKTIDSLYTPPTSSIEYLANIGENIGIAPKSAYAQEIGGSGYNVIRPVLKLWQVTRNIAYVGFILVFMAAGLMIMFRQKLNPQTVIGIQQALPGIVVGLILVTFSYFIASLIVDLSFVGARLVAGLFISTGEVNFYGCSVVALDGSCSSGDNESGLINTYNKSDAFDMYGRAGTRVSNISDVFGQVWGTLSPSAPTSPSGVDGLLKRLQDAANGARSGVLFGPGGALVGAFSGLINYSIGQAAAAGVTATLASLLIPLILGIALMIQFVKLILSLVMSYLQILLMVIFGPILIMVSAVPGRGGALSYWLKGLFANALVFPAVFAGFLFAGLLLNWNSANLNLANMPMFGGLHPDILKSVLAFGVLLGLPAIPDMVRDAFGVKAPQGFMKAAIGGFMGGVAAGKGGYNQAMEKTGIRSEQQAKQKQDIESKQAGYVQGARPVWARPTIGGRIKSFLVDNAK
ncbi:MAG: hypothetical protein PHQ59_00765 [Candidatus Daviesbacteria bacterium]|nr:hypothetical protein [Candidatus Daviesbacteria bacterium]